MPESLGERLRQARTKRGLSLRSVAQELGVSASLISQVEIGKTQPSVSTLYALASHLGVSLDELLGITTPAATPAMPPPPMFGHSGPPLPDVQRAADNPVIEMENGVRWERLAVGAGGPADGVLVTYDPGASSSIEGKLMRHAGFEYAYLLEGELTLQLEFEEHVLRPGDSLQFDSTRPHLYTNRGTAPAKGVWFVVGRRQPYQGAPDAASAPAASGAAGTADARTPSSGGAPISSAVDALRAMDDFRA
ncbi:helix-turn-helix domain-containing protein [Agromyces sp. NPDC049794]|uniref:helix-turn-helix domain-containing protein n=1 Tax=unclassified Agromyces TaxID=2639701 RepID=UPI0033FCB135